MRGSWVRFPIPRPLVDVSPHADFAEQLRAVRVKPGVLLLECEDEAVCRRVLVRGLAAEEHFPSQLRAEVALQGALDKVHTSRCLEALWPWSSIDLIGSLDALTPCF